MAWPLRSAKILAVILFSTTASAASLDAYLSNRSGLHNFKDKQYFKAYQDFLKALEKEPLHPDLQLNLGLTFVANEEWDKAEKAFMAAYDMSKGDSSREFTSLFNLGFSRWQKSNIDGALDAFQKALAIDPESIEVKTDIELMWQSQQGKGKGKQDQKGGQGQDDKNQDQKDQKDQNDKDKNKDGQYQNGKKQQPKPFDSKDLSKEDVRKILNEISNQEQSIRAKEFDKGAKERSYDKDW